MAGGLGGFARDVWLGASSSWGNSWPFCRNTSANAAACLQRPGRVRESTQLHFAFTSDQKKPTQHLQFCSNECQITWSLPKFSELAGWHIFDFLPSLHWGHGPPPSRWNSAAAQTHGVVPSASLALDLRFGTTGPQRWSAPPGDQRIIVI